VLIFFFHLSTETTYGMDLSLLYFDNAEINDIFCEGEDRLYQDLINYRRPRVTRRIRPRVDLLNYFSDDEFLRRFRVSKNSAMDLFFEIEKDITPRTMRCVY